MQLAPYFPECQAPLLKYFRPLFHPSCHNVKALAICLKLCDASHMTTPYQRYIADAAKRKAAAIRLYKAGDSFQKIGEKLGFTRARAHQIIRDAGLIRRKRST